MVMSDLNATNDGADATKASEDATAGDLGNGDAPLMGTVSDLNMSEGSSDATSADSAANGANSSDGEQGNAAAGTAANPSSQPSTGSGESTSAGELPNGADTAPEESATGAALTSVEAAAAESLSLLKRVEAAALRAYETSNTTEHNLMAWLHTHLTGAKAAAAGAGGLEGLTDEGKSILADLKNLL